MKRIRALIIALVFFLPAAPTAAQNVGAGISIADGALNSFYLAVGDYYRVPEPRVVHVKKHYRMRDDELPVVFFLASRARVEPEAIMDLRFRQGMSWLNITLHYGLTPEIYYVPVERVGPPYGKAYGHYKKHKHDYRKVVLVDEDVVNLVNLRFISDYHGVAPEAVMDMRGRGSQFVAINDDCRKRKEGYRGADNGGKGQEKQTSGGKGKGKGKGKD